jgi:hypothetical protein
MLLRMRFLVVEALFASTISDLILRSLVPQGPGISKDGPKLYIALA